MCDQLYSNIIFELVHIQTPNILNIIEPSIFELVHLPRLKRQALKSYLFACLNLLGTAVRVPSEVYLAKAKQNVGHLDALRTLLHFEGCFEYYSSSYKIR
jgi:hypothetical protein